MSVAEVEVGAAVARAAEVVPELHYTHHEGRGPTIHRTNAVFVQRDVSFLGVGPGMRVLEVGTGSGYSGALLAEVVGSAGSVTSVDVDGYLTAWANAAHHERGVEVVRCVTADGVLGCAAGAPYDRIGAWCSPPVLPRAWVEQLVEGGRVVVTLPCAPVPEVSVLAVVRVVGGVPEVEFVTGGNYIDATASQKADVALPGRWVDWEVRGADPAWVSVAWRGSDDWHRSGARWVAEQLLARRVVKEWPGVEWKALQYWAASSGDAGLTVARVGGEVVFGHSTPGSVAVVASDGRVFADGAGSESLGVLRGWLAGWEEAGRPGRDAYVAELVPGEAGWDLRLRR